MSEHENQETLENERDQEEILDTQREQNSEAKISGSKYEQLYSLHKEHLEKIKALHEETKIRREQEELEKCSFVPQTINYVPKEPEMIYEKPQKHYRYETESQSKILILTL